MAAGLRDDAATLGQLVAGAEDVVQSLAGAGVDAPLRTTPLSTAAVSFAAAVGHALGPAVRDLVGTADALDASARSTVVTDQGVAGRFDGVLGTR